MNIDQIGSTQLGQAIAPQNPNSQVSQQQFLTLLLTQMQNQSPLDPTDGTEFMAQLAQFSSLEQMTQLNVGLDILAGGLNGLVGNQAVDYIGKEVQFTGDTIQLREGGANLQYELGGEASSVTIEIKDSNGNVVRTIEQRNVASGEHSYTWDGRTDEGDEASEGNYTFSITAQNAEGETVASRTWGTGRVDAVVLRDGVPYLLIGDTELTTGQLQKITEEN